MVAEARPSADCCLWRRGPSARGRYRRTGRPLGQERPRLREGVAAEEPGEPKRARRLSLQLRVDGRCGGAYRSDAARGARLPPGGGRGDHIPPRSESSGRQSGRPRRARTFERGEHRRFPRLERFTTSTSSSSSRTVTRSDATRARSKSQACRSGTLRSSSRAGSGRSGATGRPARRNSSSEAGLERPREPRLVRLYFWKQLGRTHQGVTIQQLRSRQQARFEPSGSP